jgi:hypothetical protein
VPIDGFYTMSMLYPREAGQFIAENSTDITIDGDKVADLAEKALHSISKSLRSVFNTVVVVVLNLSRSAVPHSKHRHGLPICLVTTMHGY